MRVYLASHAVPVVSPTIKDAAVLVSGEQILSVGTRREVLAAHGCRTLDVVDLGVAVVCPGLVNAHVHFELSWMGGDPPRAEGPDPYVGWVRSLLAKRADEDLPTARDAARDAIAKSVAFGTVAIADIANRPWIVELLSESPLLGTVFHEIYSPRDEDAATTFAAGKRVLGQMRAVAPPSLDVVLSPHAPHTTSDPLLRAIGQLARSGGGGVSVHAAESAAECAWLRNGSGAFSEMLPRRPIEATPMEVLHACGLLGSRTLAVHCVHLSEDDVDLLAATGTTVVTCPRSNRSLGVGRTPVPQLLNRGIRVALGTDSLASCPDLDPFAEMAALHAEHPELPPQTILWIATRLGAESLGLEQLVGSLEPGRSARALIVPLVDRRDDPLEALLSVPDGRRWLGDPT